MLEKAYLADPIHSLESLSMHYTSGRPDIEPRSMDGMFWGHSSTRIWLWRAPYNIEHTMIGHRQYVTASTGLDESVGVSQVFGSGSEAVQIL